jgi:hypothetical protein
MQAQSKQAVARLVNGQVAHRCSDDLFFFFFFLFFLFVFKFVISTITNNIIIISTINIIIIIKQTVYHLQGQERERGASRRPDQWPGPRS